MLTSDRDLPYRSVLDQALQPLERRVAKPRSTDEYRVMVRVPFRVIGRCRAMTGSPLTVPGACPGFLVGRSEAVWPLRPCGC
jgi:hypothetical protein